MSGSEGDALDGMVLLMLIGLIVALIASNCPGDDGLGHSGCLGGEEQRCYPNDTCDDGYACFPVGSKERRCLSKRPEAIR